MKKFILAGLVLLAFSCSQKGEKTPGHILEKKKIVDIQVDLYLVEASLNSKILVNDSADTQYKALFETVMKKHNITKEDYENSLKYYSTDNESLDQIYDSVFVKLSRLENPAMYEEPKDSL